MRQGQAMVLPTYAEIMREIGARKGKVIDRAEIEKLLQAAVAAGIAGEKKTTLWLQNWTSESFDPPADYALDWSAHFDRSTRKVPSPETWNKQLIPELEALKKKILAGRKERLIQLRANAPCRQAWRSEPRSLQSATGRLRYPSLPRKTHGDRTPATNPYQSTEVVEGAQDGTDIVLGLNIKGDGLQDIVRYSKAPATRRGYLRSCRLHHREPNRSVGQGTPLRLGKQFARSSALF